MKNDDHLYLPADKTNNYNRMEPADYDKLLKSMQKENTKSDSTIVNKSLATYH